MYGILNRARLNITVAMLLVTLVSLGSGCAAHPSRGESGSIEWEVLDLTLFGNGYYVFTVVLRDAAGIGVSFHAVRIAFPDVSTVQEQLFVHRLEPHSTVRQNFRLQVVSLFGRGTFPPYAELQFLGVDDTSKPINVTLRVYRSLGRQVQAAPIQRADITPR